MAKKKTKKPAAQSLSPRSVLKKLDGIIAQLQRIEEKLDGEPTEVDALRDAVEQSEVQHAS